MSFDRIVGPEGEWKDDGGARAEGSEFSAREEFIFRSLNAAVNLYGVVTAEEFANLYATYAKDKSPAVAAPVLSVTSCWEFRGHTAHELSLLGLMPKLTEEKVYDVFGLDGDGDE